MTSKDNTLIKAVNVFADYVILNIGMFITDIFDYNRLIVNLHNKRHLSVILVFNLIWMLTTNITRLYEYPVIKNWRKIYKAFVKTYLVYSVLVYGIITFFTGTKVYFITPLYLASSLALFGITIGLWKLLFFYISLGVLFKTTKNHNNAIIIGTGGAAAALQTFFKQSTEHSYNFLGTFHDEEKSSEEGDYYLGKTADVINYRHSYKIDEIFCALSINDKKKINDLMTDARANFIRFTIIPEIYSKNAVTAQVFGHIPIISSRPEPLENMPNRLSKRLFDICFSILVIVFVFSWLFPILAILIKLESKGPVFFSQMRPGKNNNPFRCFKFRSMKINNDSDTKQATLGDARITRTGAFIRKTSLDEMPQFFNVLIGNMSVVGPRPHMQGQTVHYSQLIDKFMVRHFLKPGITGWAQVNGLRGETRTTQSMLDRVEADIWYLENWSFLLDLKIIFLTVYNIIRGEKNAF